MVETKKYIGTKNRLLYFTIISVILFFSSCGPSRYVPEKQYLLNSSTVKVDDKNVDTEPLYNYIKQKPNKKLLYLFRFHLWVYNVANSGRKWKWKRKIGDIVGEKPVLYDDYYTKKSSRQIAIYLKNKGYYNAKVRDSVIYYNNRTADVIYVVDAGKPYRIKDVDFKFEDDSIKKLVLRDTSNSLIKRGVHFDVDKLQEERARIARVLNTKGYYYFVKEFIDYQVDSALKTSNVNLTLRVKNPQKQLTDSTYAPDVHRKQKINKIYVITNFDQKRAMQEPEEYLKQLDTLIFNGYYFIYEKKMPIKPNTVIRNIHVRRDDYYNVLNVDKSYQFLSALRIYKQINIQFKETKDTTATGDEYLDCVIQLTPFTTQSYTVELVGTNSSSDIGFGGNYTFQHKNLFKGAEILDVKANAELQMLKGVSGDRNKLFNTTQIGGEARLYIPKFLLPYRSEYLSEKYEAKTSFAVSENFQQRPDYTRTITSASFGYTWKTSEYVKHFLNPIEISSIHLYDTVGFKYPAYLKGSYDNFLITAINYSFNFNNQKISKSRDFQFFTVTLETAGNLPSAYYNSVSENKTGDYYEILKIRYAQYLKSDIDFRFYHFFNPKQNIATRVFLGLGFPYGNSRELPFVKQYYCGGASSLRAWGVRSLGPGVYRDPDPTAFPNQSADLKLESSIEYRFDIFWMIKGALFLDVGNVWFMNEDKLGSDAVFKPGRFYKDLAIGSGLGLRMDLSMFIFRFDFGVKVRDPKEDESKRWILFSKKFDVMGDFLENINIGIGYPF